MVVAVVLFTDPLPIFPIKEMAEVCEKLAVTVLFASIVTWQVPVPVQSPLQPEKIYPELGVAVTVTASPWL
jgi:hypothetical protein